MIDLIARTIICDHIKQAVTDKLTGRSAERPVYLAHHSLVRLLALADIASC